MPESESSLPESENTQETLEKSRKNCKKRLAKSLPESTSLPEIIGTFTRNSLFYIGVIFVILREMDLFKGLFLRRGPTYLGINTSKYYKYNTDILRNKSYISKKSYIAMIYLETSN